MAAELIRLRNKANGVVVNVDQAGADRLGSGWEPADAKSGRHSTAKAKAAEKEAADKAAAEAEAAAKAEADAKAAADAKVAGA